VNSEALREAVGANPATSTNWLSAEFDIPRMSVVRQLHQLGKAKKTLSRSTAWIDARWSSTACRHLSSVAPESSRRAFHLPNRNLWWEVGLFQVPTNKINGLFMIKWWNLWPNKIGSPGRLCRVFGEILKA
jgi:hypothetical protein